VTPVSAPSAPPAVLFDRASLADPYAVYRQLRSSDPVHWAAREGTWFLTRYHDVLWALHEPRLSACRVMGGSAGGRVVDPLAHLMSLTMLFRDPPDHTRLRTLFNRAFTPRAVERVRPDVVAHVQALLDQVAPTGQMDVIADLAYPLPALVIARLMGVPDEDRTMFDGWVHDLAAYLGNPRLSPEQRRSATRSMTDALAYMRDLFARRRQEPGEDLLSALATIAPDELAAAGTADELFANVILVITAGHETTQNLIGNGVLALLRQPRQAALLREQPHLLGQTVEELLRYDSPAQWTGRVAREAIHVQGKQIARGQFVIAAQGAANRDPAVFADPERLDITRRENRHLAFGHGPHFCIGAALSRLEGQVAIGALVQRFPRLRLLEPRAEAAWRENFVLRGLESLPVALA